MWPIPHLYAGEVGVLVGEDDEVVCLYVDQTKEEVLPPVLPQDGQEVAPGCQGNSKHPSQESIIDESLHEHKACSQCTEVAIPLPE